MDKFLRQIKLLLNFSLTVPVNKNDFISKVSKKTVPEITLLEALSNRDKLFVGYVNVAELSLRPKRTFGQRNNIYSTKLVAKLNSTPTSVTIEGEISLTKFLPLLVLSSVVFYFVIAGVFFTQGSAFVIVPLLIQSVFMLGIFYIVFRRSIKSSKDFFEKELYFLSNNNH